jgi:hypothetical protein
MNCGSTELEQCDSPNQSDYICGKCGSLNYEGDMVITRSLFGDDWADEDSSK